MKELEDKKGSKGRKRGAGGDSDDDTEEAVGVRRRIKGKAGKPGGRPGKPGGKRKRWGGINGYVMLSSFCVSFSANTIGNLSLAERKASIQGLDMVNSEAHKL